VGVLIRLIALALLLISAAIQAQPGPSSVVQPRPSFVPQPGRVVAAALPPSLLSERDVHRHLGSGLTTTFILVARQRDADRRGAARLEIRFDLWDEVWLVRRIEFDGKEDRQRISTRESLDAWWRTPVRLFAAAADRVALTVTLSVLPFSAAEGEDARQWLSKSGGVAVPEGGSPLVTALIGTTLSAKPIRSYRWTADVVFP
jgi:hypothetical protein